MAELDPWEYLLKRGSKCAERLSSPREIERLSNDSDLPGTLRPRAFTIQSSLTD
jgi:hypothetical protein